MPEMGAGATSDSNSEVEGKAASDAAESGNPVQLGASVDETASTK